MDINTNKKTIIEGDLSVSSLSARGSVKISGTIDFTNAQGFLTDGPYYSSKPSLDPGVYLFMLYSYNSSNNNITTIFDFGTIIWQRGFEAGFIRSLGTVYSLHCDEKMCPILYVSGSETTQTNYKLRYFRIY